MTQIALLDEARGLSAHRLHNKILKLKRRSTMDMLELGAYLKVMKETKAYQDLNYDTFESYLASPELGLERSGTYRLIQVVAKFIEKLGVPTERLALISGSKLEELVPHVGDLIDEDNVDDWLAQAENLSITDLKDELADATGKPTKRMCGYSVRLFCSRRGKPVDRSECDGCQDKI